MVRELADDHRSGERVREAVGLLHRLGAIPVVVACGNPAAVPRLARRGDQPTYCCNEIYTPGVLDEDRAPRISHTCCVTLSGEQLRQLHEVGEISWGRDDAMMGAGCLVLLEEVFA